MPRGQHENEAGAQFCEEGAPALALAHPVLPGRVEPPSRFAEVATPRPSSRLLTKLRKGRAQRGTGDLNHPFERAIELQDQKDCSGHRQCTIDNPALSPTASLELYLNPLYVSDAAWRTQTVLLALLTAVLAAAVAARGTS